MIIINGVRLASTSVVGPGGVKVYNVTDLNVLAPYTKEITLSNSVELDELCTTVLEFVPGAGEVKYNCAFNNGDASNFTYNSDYVTFDGQMEIRDTYTLAMTSQGALGAGTLYETAVINPSNYNKINSMTYNDTTPNITMPAVPIAQIIKASGDIDLTGVVSVNSFTLTATETANGVVKTAISFDGGTTYKAWSGSAWVTVDTTSISDFASKGMSIATLNTLKQQNIFLARGTSNTMRLAYYLNEPQTTDTALTDTIIVNVSMSGANEVCATSKYTLTYDQETATISYAFSEDGTFTINYID